MSISREVKESQIEDGIWADNIANILLANEIPQRMAHLAIGERKIVGLVYDLPQGAILVANDFIATFRKSHGSENLDQVLWRIQSKNHTPPPYWVLALQ